MQSNERPLISFVIPIKDPISAVLSRCLFSILALNNNQSNKFEIIIVDSSASPCELAYFAEEKNISIIYSFPPKGIYSAYNIGVRSALGKYVMFLGHDDFLLPSFVQFLSSGVVSSEQYDVIIGRVVVENRGVVIPPKHFFALIFTNWVHQGMLYRREIFEIYTYRPEFKIQADHDLNIKLAKRNNRFYFSELIFSYFSTGGLSSNAIDYRFRTEMPRIISEQFGLAWGLVCYARRFAGDLKSKIINIVKN